MGLSYNPNNENIFDVTNEKTDHRTDNKTDHKTDRKTNYNTNVTHGFGEHVVGLLDLGPIVLMRDSI